MALLEVETESGPILVDVQPEPGLQPVQKSPDGVVARAGESLESSLSVLQRVSRSVGTALQDAGATGAEVTFSLQPNAKGRLIVAEASAAAHFTVKLTLRPPGGA